MLPKPRDLRGTLTNVLIEEMRKDYYRQKYKNHIPAPLQASTSETIQDLNEGTESSSDSKDTATNHSFESETYHKDANVDIKGSKSEGTPV